MKEKDREPQDHPGNNEKSNYYQPCDPGKRSAKHLRTNRAEDSGKLDRGTILQYIALCSGRPKIRSNVWNLLRIISTSQWISEKGLLE